MPRISIPSVSFFPLRRILLDSESKILAVVVQKMQRATLVGHNAEIEVTDEEREAAAAVIAGMRKRRRDEALAEIFSEPADLPAWRM